MKNGGYTKIPNKMLEALTRIRVSGEEWQCLCLILRKIYGWHKMKDWIANSQFVRETGMKKQNVNRAIKKLIKKNIVIKNDDKRRATYSIQEDATKWEPSSKKMTMGAPHDEAVVLKISDGGDVIKRMEDYVG